VLSSGHGVVTTLTITLCVVTPLTRVVRSLLGQTVHIMNDEEVQATAIMVNLCCDPDALGLPGGPGWVKLTDIQAVCKTKGTKKQLAAKKKKVLSLARSVGIGLIGL
jgi:hypothetical protein